MCELIIRKKRYLWKYRPKLARFSENTVNAHFAHIYNFSLYAEKLDKAHIYHGPNALINIVNNACSVRVRGID